MSAAATHLPPSAPPISASCVDLRCPECDANRLTAKYWPRVFAGRITDRWRLFCAECNWSRFQDSNPEGER